MSIPVEAPLWADETMSPTAARVLLVTGMSGAGKSSTLKALEDLGFEAVDNLPLSLLERLIVGGSRTGTAPGTVRPLAIGVDIRTRDFEAGAFHSELERLSRDQGVEVSVLFLDCDDAVLSTRFAATRRRHPLALDRPVSDGIRHERELLLPLRERADRVVDTSDKTPGDLKRVLFLHFGEEARPVPIIFVTSFSFARGLPREADLVFDVRFLNNPHYDADLRLLTGEHPRVGAFIEADADFAPFLDGLFRLLGPLIPRYADEGKSYLTIAIGCTGGRHRSVFTAMRLADWLERQGRVARLQHRDLVEARA